MTAALNGSPEAMPCENKPVASCVFAEKLSGALGAQATAVEAVKAPKIPRRVKDDIIKQPNNHYILLFILAGQ